MRFTIEESVGSEAIEAFLPTYQDSFAPLASLSAQKQVLSPDEYRAVMESPRSLKFCGWADDGNLAALAVVVTDISLVPWLSPPFFQRVYPDQFARNALATVMTILVTERDRNEPWIVGLVRAIGGYVAEIDGVALFDCCQYNVETVQFPQLIASITADWVTLEPTLLDYQNYYGYTVHPDESIDLREFRAEAAIDLRSEPSELPT